VRAISKQAASILARLVDGLDEPGQSKKLDNARGAFMAVAVECIGPRVFSVAHYFEQHGDLVPDPEMTFWRDGFGDFYPLSITHGALGIHRECLPLDGNGRPVLERLRPREQADQASFAAGWMRNIRAQQGV
jgi:hypothetical protein